VAAPIPAQPVAEPSGYRAEPAAHQDLPTVVEPDLSSGSRDDLDVPDFLK
jgi:cell division protein FtsZ